MMAKIITRSHVKFPLDGILGNTGNVRVLRTLLEHGGALSVSRLANETRMTPPGIRLVLNTLVSYGLVEVLGQGRTQLYACDNTHRWYGPLTILFMTEQSFWSDMLKKARKLLKDNSQIVAAWLYGSVARGEDKPRSDIDFAVLMQSGGDEEKVRSAFEALQKEFHTTLSVVTVSEDDLKNGSISAPWWNNVLTEGQQLKGESRKPTDPWPKPTASPTP